nr:DUF2513 domain-containing protein [Sedimentibacter sp.]
MKRDMELMRKILFEIENKFEPGIEVMHGIKIEGYEMVVIGDHCELLYQAGLIKDYKPTRGGMGSKLLSFSIGNLTNRGYNYLELIRSDQTWEKTNEEVNKKNLPQTIETYGTIAASITGAFMREFNR